MLALGTAATTAIALIASLAVAGALEAMQRNHGGWLIAAIVLTLLAAVFWAVGVLARDRAITWNWKIWKIRFPKADADMKNPRRVQPYLTFLACVLFVVGLLAGVVGMVMTQQDQERPAVTATLDQTAGILTAKATANDLGTEDRLLTELTGIKETGKLGIVEKVRQYYAISGPDESGTATQEFTYSIPSGVYVALAVGATTGSDTSACFALPEGFVTEEALALRAEEVAQERQPGCVVISLP